LIAVVLFVLIGSPELCKAGFIAYTFTTTGDVHLGSTTYTNVVVSTILSGDTVNVSTPGTPGAPPYPVAFNFVSVEYKSDGNFDVYASSVAGRSLGNYNINSNNFLYYYESLGGYPKGYFYDPASALASYNLKDPISNQVVQSAAGTSLTIDQVGPNTFISIMPTTLAVNFSASITSVPEPSSLVLLAVATVLGYGLRKRRKMIEA
jgi:PEP-CTERM motif